MSNLEENIIDNILECFAKLGYTNTAINFYYPITSLLVLLDCDKEHLDDAIDDFKKRAADTLGNITIEELTSERGRYEIVIPISGVEWVHNNYKPTVFWESFISEIQKPNRTLEDMVGMFRSFSQDIIIDMLKDDMWAISFRDKTIDKYIYLIEQNEFGLQYHRFTSREFEDIKNT